MVKKENEKVGRLKLKDESRRSAVFLEDSKLDVKKVRKTEQKA